MASKDEALEQIASIARSHQLTADEIAAALSSPDSDGSQRSARLLGRIFGLLGGIFVFAGLGVFIALNWDVMNSAARIIITLGSGMAVFVLALIAGNDDRYSKLTTPLFLVAAILQPMGILVAINEFSSGGDWRYAALLTAGTMALQQGAVFARKRYTTLLFTTLVFAYWGLVVMLDLMAMEGDLIAVVTGVSIMLMCLGLEKTAHRSLTPFWFLLGSVAFYYGFFSLVEDSAAELLFLASACGGVFISTVANSRSLLAVSTVAILAYVSYFTREHFLDSIGWPILLILLGLLMIGLASVALRISNRYISNETN
jgi:hypothetical protein